MGTVDHMSQLEASVHECTQDLGRGQVLGHLGVTALYFPYIPQ